MIFFEKLKIFDAINLLWNRRAARYATKSLGARFIETIAGRFGFFINARKIDFCDVQIAEGIRRNAYQNAEACLELLPGKHWADHLSSELKIDFWLIVQKFFFDELYIKFEFVEMALRFADENPHETHAITVDKEFMEAYADRLGRRFALRYSPNTTVWGVVSLLLLPLFVEFYRLRKGEKGCLRHDNCVVCEVDGEKTLEMFSNLFYSLEKNKLVFVTEKRNAVAFSDERLKQLGVGVLGLRDEGLCYLRRVVWQYIGRSFSHLDEISGFGCRLFRIFYILMQGRADVIEGSDNVYCTYEHLVTSKAVRNEFLKSTGNRTIFIPMNAHVTPQYYHSEILVNYDVMCAAGMHTEVLYRQKRALTDVYLNTGSYDSHRGSLRMADKNKRIERLRAFKGDGLSITIVSPGICDPTYRHEVKLMRLACSLSKIPGVSVIIRLKPVTPETKYSDFYVQHTEDGERILLTSGEYELFDFLEISDLVVTTISNAAYDLAQAGAQVMLVDYLKDPDLILAWSAVDGVLLAEDMAYPTILSWIENAQYFRAKWAEKMKDFSGHIGFHFKDFEAYRNNLLRQLDNANLGISFPESVKAEH